MADSLVPTAANYYNEGLNVLFIGEHGTGKTQTVREMAKLLGIKTKYYSCATLDPFTDLVGIPTPTMTADGKHKTLEMIRPREIDECELIFFDELNRADDKVLNAVMELVQFGSINGEKLPFLKCCWAAINPPSGDYHVTELDPALVDRFHVYEEIKPRPVVRYYQEVFEKIEGVEKPVAKAVSQALIQWWTEHDKKYQQKADKDYDPKDYISPRRLETIGSVCLRLGSAENVAKLLPPGGRYDSNKLKELLKRAIDPNFAKKVTSAADKTGLGPNSAIEYDSKWIEKNLDLTVNLLRDIDCTDETKERVVNAINEKSTPESWFKLMNRFAEENCIESMWIEAAFHQLPDDKKSKVNDDFMGVDTALDKIVWKYDEITQ